MKTNRILILLLTVLIVAFITSCGGGGGGGSSSSSGSSPSSGVTLVSITVSPTNPAIAISTAQQFKATGTFSDTSTQDLTTSVTWSSSSTSVATIDSNGKASSLAAGTTTIKAMSGSIPGSTTLTVTPATLVSIAVTPTNPGIAVGTTQQFKATGIFSDNSIQDITTSVLWNSSSTSVAKISNVPGSDGIATSSAVGPTTIMATLGGISSVPVTLTVTPATLVSISVTPTNPSIAVGTTQQFTATGIFSDNSTQNLTSSATWASGTSVATVSNTGLVTASSNGGTTTITATSGGISGATTLTVNRATLKSISVMPTNPSMAIGFTQQFTATGIFSDNSTQDLTSSVTWSSSNTAVATIAGTLGKATSVASGTTTITATLGNIPPGTAALTVTSISLVSISVTPSKPTVGVGTAEQFTATGTFSDGSTQDITTSVLWSSSTVATAIISNASGSQGNATPVANGTTTIIASLGSISGSTTFTVSSLRLVAITITPLNPSIALGTTQQLTATGSYVDASGTASTQDITTSVLWSSSASSVATVSNASGSIGNVTSVITGTTTIKATSGNISGSVTLTVTPATPISITVGCSTVSGQCPPSIVLGATEQFTATGNYSDGSTQNLTASVVWSSSSATVATISNAAGSNGKATSAAAGATTITATLGGISGSSTLTITSPTGTAPSSYSTPIVAVHPASIAVDSQGNIWVTNFGGNSVLELPTGLTLSGGALPSPIPAPTTYTYNSASPFGIAIDYVGDIWTADYNTGDVAMIDLNEPAYDVNACPTAPLNASAGLYIYQFARGSLSGPHGIAIDSSRNVWVTNYGSNTVTKLIPNYTFCSTSASHPATVSIATNVAYAVGNNPYAIAIDSRGNVWVTNYGDNTVTELNSSGTALGTFAVGAAPQGIAIDPSGNVWVANSGGSTVTELSSSGSLLGTFTVGTGPHSIAIETSGNVWVTNFGSTTVPGNTITELVFNGNSTLQQTLTFTVGNNPEGIAIDFWKNVWVTNYYDNTLTVWQGAAVGPHFSPYEGPIWPQ